MRYTGIRVVPFVTPSRIIQPHLARYVFTAGMVSKVNTSLDIACGTGYGALLLRESGCSNVWGVDLDRLALGFGTDNYGDLDGVTFLQADACTLPFADDSFNLITSFETFEHILDSERFLSELRRVVMPSGLLLVSTPHAPMFEPFGKPPDLRKDYTRLGLGHKHHYRAGQFRAMLAEHFCEVALYGQYFRRASLVTRLARQAERIFVGGKYKLATVTGLRAVLGPFLSDVLPQPDLAFRDRRWEVRPWDDPETEPIFCVAVCREKKV